MVNKKRTKRKLRSDPHAERESRRYADPIASREMLLAVLAHEGRPMPIEKISQAVELGGKGQGEALSRRLNAMVRAGQIIQNRRGGYMLIDEQELHRGRIAANKDGFGFLIADEEREDIYLSPRQMRMVLHGDTVVVRLIGEDRRGRPEGIIVEVLERANQTIVGRLHKESGLAFVIPENKRIHQDILIPNDKLRGARHQQIVVAEIIEQPSMHSQPIAAVCEVMGDRVKPGMEIDIAIKTFDIPAEWPKQVVREAKKFRPEVSKADCNDRVDLRALPLVTIDGEDARDFDDAVFCEPKENGWRLVVAIADVAHYVQPHSGIDAEAQKRGTSVYFPGRVVPMLPEVLSNGLCSLNPRVDRLCMVSDIHFDKNGDLLRSRFYNAVMHSQARLTYTQVAAELQQKHSKHERAKELKNLYALYQVLQKARKKRGAIEFESTDVGFEFDDQGKVIALQARERNDAHRLIEECMIAANVAAARFLQRHKIPALYRNHEGPNSDKLLDLRSFLNELGLRLSGGDDPQPMDYSRLIGRTKERADAAVIQTVLLRSLSQAMYQPPAVGHFGLALEKYAHFTSPIRRYPDLLVHRAIKHILKHKNAQGYIYSPGDMQALGSHCSTTERRAEEATRDAAQRLKCEYMLDHVGKDFEGVVSAVTGFGMFVELKGMYVDGLVHITSLPRDYYHFEAKGHRLIGEKSGRIYRLGDKVKVTLAQVDVDSRKIDLVLAEPQAAKKKRSRRGR